MDQGNLFVAHALVTGCRISWEIDHTKSYPAGLLSVTPTFSKTPSSNGYRWTKTLIENDVEMLGAILADVPAGLDLTSCAGRFARHMQRSYSDHCGQRQESA